MGTIQLSRRELVSKTLEETLESQVGGLSHRRLRKLPQRRDVVCKPLHVDHRGFREVAFYESVQHAVRHSLEEDSSFSSSSLSLLARMRGWNINQSVKHEYLKERQPYGKACHQTKRLLHEIELLRRLSSFLPFYHGMLTTYASSIHDGSRAGSSFLVLEDATHAFSEPCVLDLKLGTRTYEPNASPSKKQREEQKYPPQKKLGVRIVGMRVIKNHHTSVATKRTSTAGGDVAVFDKYFGFSIQDEEELAHAIDTIFIGQNVIRRRERSREFLIQLMDVIEWFLENDAFLFCSSSLLLVYEGGTSFPNLDKKPTLRVIDLAHVRANTSLDEGYLVGLRTLERILKGAATSLSNFVTSAKYILDSDTN
jgi:hypothetical protein